MPTPLPTRHTGGALPPGVVGVSGSHKPGDTTQHHPSTQVSKQGSQQVTELLGCMGRKRSQGLPPGLLSVCQSIFLSVCLQGPVLTRQAVCAVATPA